MGMKQLKVYEFPNVCVACGAPAIPGEQICRECQRIAHDARESLSVSHSSELKKFTFREILKFVLFEKPTQK